MAGDWIKIQHSLPGKPEVFAIARVVRQNRDTVVGLLVRFWAWCDENSTDGTNLSVTSDDVDDIVGLPGFAAALRSSGWLSGEDGSLQVPNFERHNGSSAKARALESEAKRLRRLSDTESDTCPTKEPSNVRPEKRRREETRGEYQSSKDVGNGGIVGGAGVVPSKPPSPPSRSSKEVRDEIRQRHTANLEHLEWEQAIAFAEAAARKIPPAEERDRRAWIKFGVLAATAFSEAWLADTADAVSKMAEVKKTRQACFVAALKVKARELYEVGEPQFTAMVRSIEIPTDVWKSQALEVRK